MAWHRCMALALTDGIRMWRICQCWPHWQCTVPRQPCVGLPHIRKHRAGAETSHPAKLETGGFSNPVNSKCIRSCGSTAETQWHCVPSMATDRLSTSLGAVFWFLILHALFLALHFLQDKGMVYAMPFRQAAQVCPHLHTLPISVFADCTRRGLFFSFRHGFAFEKHVVFTREPTEWWLSSCNHILVTAGVQF